MSTFFDVVPAVNIMSTIISFVYFVVYFQVRIFFINLHLLYLWWTVK